MSAATASKGHEKLLISDAGAEIAATTSYVQAQATSPSGTAGVIFLGHSTRRLTIWGHVDAGAAGSIVSIVVGLRACENEPATTDRWYPASKADDVSTNAVLSAAPLLGTPGGSLQPAWSQNTVRPIDCRTAAAVAAADEVPFKFTLDVADALWARISYAQVDGGAAAKILAYYSLSAG